MAESNSSDANGNPRDFDEELDEMLQDASDSSNTEENDVLNDEDAIDRLLMKDDDSLADSEQQTTEQIKTEASDAETIDEFADIDDLIESVTVDNDETNSQTEPLDEGKDRIDTESGGEEKDFFEEIDEFADEDNSQETSNDNQQESADRQLSAADADQEDFSTEEFDISSDENDEISGTAGPGAQETVSEEKLLPDSVLSADDQAGQEENDALTVEEPQTNFDESLSTQVIQLSAELEGVKQAMAATSEAIEKNAKAVRITGQDQQMVSNKNQIISYAALAVAAIAIIVAAILSYANSGLQSEVAELTGVVTDLEVLAAKANNDNTDAEIVSVKNSFAESEKEMLFVKGQLNDLMDQFKAVTSPTSEPNEAAKQQVSALENQLADVNQKITTLQRQVAKLKKPKPTSAHKSKKIPTATEWTVNLVSFKQEWYAKKKAAEFKKQGIPVEVVNATIKGEQWYRIRVSGFKTKYEAGSYAARVKKALNLSSVWVTRK